MFPILPGGRERWTLVPDGEAGSLATLQRMAEIIRQPDTLVTDFAVSIRRSSELETLTDAELAEHVFAWVQRVMLYTADAYTPFILEEIRHPGYLLHEIQTLGTAQGDCDDYVVLLGAIYRALGWPVTLVAVATAGDGVLDHVFLTVNVDGETITADGIVQEPFGWEVPADEQLRRVEYPV